MTATRTIGHWQFDVVEMLTVDSGTKMDIAKTLHVNSMVDPDATITFIWAAQFVLVH